jgi:hypothetical protein
MRLRDRPLTVLALGFLLAAGFAPLCAGPTIRFWENNSYGDWKIYTIAKDAASRSKAELGQLKFKNPAGEVVGELGKDGSPFTLKARTRYAVECISGSLVTSDYHQFRMEDNLGLWAEYSITRSTGSPVYAGLRGGDSDAPAGSGQKVFNGLVSQSSFFTVNGDIFSFRDKCFNMADQ